MWAATYRSVPPWKRYTRRSSDITLMWGPELWLDLHWFGTVSLGVWVLGWRRAHLTPAEAWRILEERLRGAL